MKKIAIIMDTRPEIIKLMPLVLELEQRDNADVHVLASGQHREMAQQVFTVFDYAPHSSLGLMQSDQSLNSLLSRSLIAIEAELNNIDPDIVVIQGDTTTALAGALASFHLHIPLAHVEAGLRTYDFEAPFPEEMNRSVISKMAALHFCPSEHSKNALLVEGITGGISVVGNTVVDALEQVREKMAQGSLRPDDQVLALSEELDNFILVTGHRREHFDGPLSALCGVLKELCAEDSSLHVVYPVHLNSKVQRTVYAELSDLPQIHLSDPLNYPSLIHLMEKAKLIVTDSGGIQEEAPSLGTRVLVTRVATERPEAIEAGCSLLTPLTDPTLLFKTAKRLLASDELSWQGENPYGDGKSSIRIADALLDFPLS